MGDVVVEGKILRWGNSYGIRIKKADLEREDLDLGEEVAVRIEKKGDKVDLSHFPTFSGGRSDVSERHDEYLARGLQEELEGHQTEGDEA